MSQPNILVFLTDDHGQWAAGCYGNQELHTPNMDALAEGGARFVNAFTNTPVCSPARATFYTGRMPSQHGLHDWLYEIESPYREHPGIDADQNIGQLLQTAGYETAQIGKWHCGRSWQPRPGFDHWFAYAESQYPHFGDINFSDQGQTVAYHGYQTTAITDAAVNVLRARQEDKPLFMFVGYVDTHTPYEDHPERWVSRYRKASFADIPRETFSSAHGDPTYGWPYEANSSDEREARAQYYAAVSMIDEQIGRLMDELAAQNELDNTLIVYTADHGNMCGQHGLNCKGNCTTPQNFVDDSSILIPLLMRWPKAIAPEQVQNAFVDHCDLHQTLLDAAQVELPQDVRARINSPGHSFLPMLRGEEQAWTNVYFGEYGNARCIRTEKWKYIQRGPGPNGDFGDELYDLVNDPRERENCLSEHVGSTELTALQEQLQQFFAQHTVPEKDGWDIATQPRTSPDCEPWWRSFGQGQSR